MQRSFPDPSLSPLYILYLLLATVLGWVGRSAYKWVLLWLNRKKPAAEIDVSEAAAFKTRAEARRIHADADSQYNVIVERLHEQIHRMQVDVDRIRSERNDCQEELAHLHMTVSQLRTESRMDKMFIARLHAATKLGMELKDLPPTIDEVIILLQDCMITTHVLIEGDGECEQ